MKTLLLFCLTAVSIFLAWQRQDFLDGKTAAETKVLELTNELENERKANDVANARIAQLSNQPKPTPRPNWIEEKNRNWQSPLGRGSYDNRPAFTGTPAVNTYPVPAQTTYYTDFKGRYWVDSSGTKNYVP